MGSFRGKGGIGYTCSEIVSNYLGLLQTWDLDADGTIGLTDLQSAIYAMSQGQLTQTEYDILTFAWSNGLQHRRVRPTTTKRYE